MPLVDLPLPQLQEYRPSPTREPDFDAFWEGTLAEASRIPLEIEVEPVADYPVPGLRLARIRYSGWAGSRICAWWLVPP
jgi:cephalosporin-C deacetylase